MLRDVNIFCKINCKYFSCIQFQYQVTFTTSWLIQLLLCGLLHTWLYLKLRIQTRLKSYCPQTPNMFLTSELMMSLSKDRAFGTLRRLMWNVWEGSWKPVARHPEGGGSGGEPRLPLAQEQRSVRTDGSSRTGCGTVCSWCGIVWETSYLADWVCCENRKGFGSKYWKVPCQPGLH